MKDKIMYGGSFNPPTIAHYAIIKTLCKLYDSQIIVVPNGDNYNHKKMVSFFHRKNMLELMLKGYNNIIISDIENVTEYHGTYQTAKLLGHPEIVIGDDSLMNLAKWINYQNLIKENTFIIITRNYQKNDLINYIQNNEFLNSYFMNFTFVEVNFPNVSSSLYRNYKQENLLPFEVVEYIKKNHLYEV